ncbi:hypothetical protein [Rhodocaloribacter sp.]
MSTPFDKKRAALILLAFIAGGAVPIQLVTLSFGYAQYVKGISLGPKVILTAHEFASFYVPFVYVPALVLLAGIAWYGRKHYPDVFRRIVVGLACGALATVSLDFFRQMGVIQGWLPGDTPTMFGKMVTGSNNFAYFYPVGVFVHFMNGANFGLFYTFVWGKQANYKRAVFWATTWAVLVEMGMMTGPPMGPMVGLFGVRYAWPQLFLLTLAAHIAFGITLGILAQYFLKDEDRGWLLTFILGKPRKNIETVGQ